MRSYLHVRMLPIVLRTEHRTLQWSAVCPGCAHPLFARSSRALDAAKTDHAQHGCCVHEPVEQEAHA